MVIGACVPYANGNSEEGQNEKVYMSMELLFEDQELAHTTKAKIENDYRYVLSSLEPKGRRTTRGNNVRINDTDITITESFLFSARFLYYPGDDLYSNEFGRIARLDNGDEFLFISNKLSEGYEKVISLIDNNKEEFELLPDFVQILNSMDKGTLPSIENLILYNGRGARAMNVEMKKAVEGDHELRERYNEQFITEFSDFTFEKRSILDYFTDDGRLHARVLMSKRSSDKGPMEMYVVYDEGRWKLLIPLM